MRWINGLGAVCVVLLVALNSPSSVLPALSSQDLGSVAVNATITLSFQLSGLSTTSSFGLQYGTEFALIQTACTGSPSTCTVQVSFTPKYPGVREDALRVLGNGGTLLATTLLHGIGLSSEPVLRPGTLLAFAGTGTLGTSGDNGPATSAKLENPQGLAIDGIGNVYLVDSLAQVVRKVTAATGVITTVAGPANSAGLNAPTAVTVDGAGNLYIADSQNNRIRRVDAASGQITTVAGNGTVSLILGDGNPATQASLNHPVDVEVDPAGNLYIADQYNGRIRRVDAATGVITTVAGGGTPGPGTDGIGDGGLAVNAVLNGPSSVALDAAGNLYIADTGDNLIREVNGGIISVVAGNGTAAYSGDGGAAVNASLNAPASVRVDAGGNLYISDAHNNVIRQVNGAGMIATVASHLSNPGGVAVDSQGNLYIADQGNSMVRELASGPTALSFTVTSVGQISAPQTVSIDNVGNQAVSISQFSLTGNFLQQSSGAIDCDLDMTLPAGGTCAVAVAFAPQTAGSLSGNLSLKTNSPVSLALNGIGSAIASPDPTVNTSSLLFPEQVAGVPSAAQVVTISNPGSTVLTITGISLSGSNALDFSTTSTCQSLLAAHGTCTVSVVFTPQAGGPRSATLLLTEAASAAFSQSVLLQGTAAEPPLTVTPSLTFGAQTVGTVSPAQTVTVTNSSALNLEMAGASLSGPSDFSITGSTCGSVLSAHSSCTVTLTFSPVAVGQEQASLEFTNQAGNSPQTVTIQGTGAIPVLQAAGGLSVVNLGETGLGGSATLQLAFSNTGQAVYSINAVTISGANATEFSVTNGCGTSVAPGASCMVSIRFAPAGVGNRAASLTIAGNGPEASVTVALAGSAIGQTTFDGARAGDIRASGDFDGDGKTDYVVWRPSNGTWYVLLSSRPGWLIQQWGLPGDIPVPGDYDGDGKTDFAVWRPSTGAWYVLTASSIMTLNWGLPGDIPVPGNYDGTGKTDFAVWRPSTGAWYVLTASSIMTLNWGLPGDIPR